MIFFLSGFFSTECRDNIPHLLAAMGPLFFFLLFLRGKVQTWWEVSRSKVSIGGGENRGREGRREMVS